MPPDEFRAWLIEQLDSFLVDREEATDPPPESTEEWMTEFNEFL
jgi:hypothetical protein